MKDLLKDVLFYIIALATSLLTLLYGITVCVSADSLVLTIVITVMCAGLIGYVIYAGVYVLYYDYKSLN